MEGAIHPFTTSCNPASNVLRDLGNKAFQQKKFRDAVELYTAGLAVDPENHLLLANRSAAYLQQGWLDEALQDALKTVQIQPGWARGHYRIGTVLAAKRQWLAALQSLQESLRLEPNKDNTLQAIKYAQSKIRSENEQRLAQGTAIAKDISFTRAAKRQDEMLHGLFQQFEQSLGAPEWEPEDWLWRPTFLPSMCLPGIKGQAPALLPQDAPPNTNMCKEGSTNATAGMTLNSSTLKEGPTNATTERTPNCSNHANDGSRTQGCNVLRAASTGTTPEAMAIPDYCNTNGASGCGRSHQTATDTSNCNQIVSSAGSPQSSMEQGFMPLLCRLVNQLGELNAPKHVLEALHDGARLAVYKEAIKHALGEQPGAHVLVLSSSAGVLALMAATLGARKVTCVERNIITYHMAHQLLSINYHWIQEACPVELAPVPIFSCRLNRTTQATYNGDTTMAQNADYLKPAHSHHTIAEPADILVTDWFDFSLLGFDVLPAIEHAARHLTQPGARMIPAVAMVHAAVAEMELADVMGFNMRPLEKYMWHPGPARKLNLHRWKNSGQLQIVGDVRNVLRLDLQAFVDVHAMLACTKGHQTPKGPFHQEATHAVCIPRKSSITAVIFWYDLVMHNGCKLCGTSSCGSSTSSPEDSKMPVPSSTSTEQGQQKYNTQQATSFGESLLWIDTLYVQQGDQVRLTVKQEYSRLHFNVEVGGMSFHMERPRHVTLPDWHFDMLCDSSRNHCYDGAIRRAIRRSKAVAGGQSVTVLDLGAGSGLLSMMAIRAGADRVVAVEASEHLFTVMEEILALNGCLSKCSTFRKDARVLTAGRDFPKADLVDKADVLVFEVFDSGLLGEGALSLLAAARRNLLKSSATIIPAHASILCAPAQVNWIGKVAGSFDAQQLNQFNWRPDYEAVDLQQYNARDGAAEQQGRWLMLADPQTALEFPFQQGLDEEESSAHLNFCISCSGWVNAVVFWFHLILDDKAELDSGPTGNVDGTWQQAVQWITPRFVQPGETLHVTTSHDNSGVTFKVNNELPGHKVGSHSQDVPEFNPLWRARYTTAVQGQSALFKGMAQDPLVFRQAASAMLKVAARPMDYGADQQSAAHMCARIMA